MIRILYISRINLLSGRTNVYNLAKTCEAINKEKNFNVKLVTTNTNSGIDVIFKNTEIHQPFDIICLGATNTASPYNGKIWHWTLMFLYANVRLVWFFIVRLKEFDALYFRDETLFPSAIFARVFMRKNVFFEVHSVLKRRARQCMNILSARYADGVIAISSGLERHYKKYNPNILLSLCSAAEYSWFDYSRDMGDFRKQLGLPIDAFLVGYTGVVGPNPNNDYYELDDIVKSLALLPKDILLVIVGELNNNGEWLRRIAAEKEISDRVIILPWQERNKIPRYLQSFNVNLIPKRKKDLVGDSPAKMFPALAARRPIVAGRAECIAEVLTDGVDAILVRENTPPGWAEAITAIYKDKALAESLSNQAAITCGAYTWDKRGSAIAGFIKRRLNSHKL